VAVLLVCVTPLYLLARNKYGARVAIAAYVFLVLNPLLPRVMCWDLTPFLSIPAALGAISLWYLSSADHRSLVVLAGFLFGISINSHVFSGTAIAVFLGIETVFALRRPRGMEWLGARVALAAAGGLACMALGLLFYWRTVGYVSPLVLWSSTFGAMQAGRQYTLDHFVPFSSYYATNYEIYVPVCVTLLLVVLCWQDLLKDSLEARISWFAVAYLLAYMIAVFVLRMNIVFEFWYFGHLTVIMFLAVPVILGRLTSPAGSSAPLIFMLGLLAVAGTIALDFNTARRWSAAAYGSPTAVLIVGVAILFCAALVASRRRAAVLLGTFLAAATLQVPFLSLTHLGIYNRANVSREMALFDAIRQFQQLMNRVEKPGQRIMLWYPSDSVALASLASSDLLFTLQDPFSATSFPAFGDAERRKLAQASVQSVLLLGETRATLNAATTSLDAARQEYSTLREETWGYAPLVVYAKLLQLNVPVGN